MTRNHGRKTSPAPGHETVPDPPGAAASQALPVPGPDSEPQSPSAIPDEEEFITMLALMGYFD